MFISLSRLKDVKILTSKLFRLSLNNNQPKISNAKIINNTGSFKFLYNEILCSNWI